MPGEETGLFECSMESVPPDENIVIPRHIEPHSSMTSMVNTAVDNRFKLLEVELTKHIETAASFNVRMQIDELTQKVNGIERRLQAMQELHLAQEDVFLGSGREEAAKVPNEVSTRPRRPVGRQCTRLVVYPKKYEWKVGTSSWEAPILIGHPYFNTWTSAMVLIMLFLNLASQSVFIYIVAEHLTTITFPKHDIDGFHYFRTFVAHDVTELDLNTELTLAQRVCDKDVSLHLGSKQLETVELVDEYTTDSIGSLMCLAASLCWIFTVLPELQTSVHFFWAMVALPRVTKSATSDGVEFALDHVGIRRQCSLLMISLVRIAIACFLLVWGLKYLAYTVSLPDLLLNAVALELVLCIDEITFAALAPVRMQSFIQKMTPLQIPRVEQWKGVDCQSITSFLLAMVSLVVSTILWILPQANQLKVAKIELCQGRKDVVFGMMQDGFLTWADANISEVTQLQTTTKYNVLRQLIHNPRERYHAVIASGLTDNLLNFFAIGASKGRANVLEQSGWTAAQLSASYNFFCQDIGNNTLFGQRFLGGIRDIMKNQSIAECADVKIHCGRETFEGRSVRQACPETCGCHSLESALVPIGQVSGCPPGCVQHAQRQREQRQKTCTDVEQGVFDEYDRGYRTFYGDFQGMEFLVDLIRNSTKFFAEHGCDGRKYAMEFAKERGVTDLDFCDADNWPTGVKSLKWYCPQTCNCTAGTNECPLTCPPRRPVNA